MRRPPGDPSSPPKPYPRFIPPPPTNLTNLSLGMDIILPDEAKAAKDAGILTFHAVGDTGGIHGDDVEKAISDAMDNQISTAPAKSPAPTFYYNLGDVVYFNGESSLYNSQFYEPYQNYHAVIFAIAGNHDGDTSTRPGDPVDTEPSLFGLMRNFCDNASHYDSPYRATMTQPLCVLDARNSCRKPDFRVVANGWRFLIAMYTTTGLIRLLPGMEEQFMPTVVRHGVSARRPIS